MRNLGLDGTGGNYLVPAVLSYVSSNGEKNEGEPWDGDAYWYAAIIPGMYSTAMSYALWYKKMNGDCSCRECKRWCRYCFGKGDGMRVELFTGVYYFPLGLCLVLHKVFS